jgi:cell division cycle 2-like protein
MFPTWPAKSEQQRVKRGTSPRPPEGGLGYSQLVRGPAGKGPPGGHWLRHSPHSTHLASQGDDDLKETGFHLTTTNQGASAAGPGFSLKF